MKYAALYYKNTENFGDDIQTYASLQYLKKIDYIIDRESIDDFVPDKKEYVAAILNGWYQHRKYNFPMSPYIYPKLVSMHFTSDDPYDIVTTKKNYDYLDGFAKDAITKFGKVGCRDYGTLKVLQEKGYDCYFSGCLTLTIDNISKVEKKPYICLVDLDDKIVNYIKSITNLEVKVMTHEVNQVKYSKLSFDQRMNRVKEYLTIYQNAQLVITNRLHVALPCLALQTNVVLVYYDCFKDRLETYKEYLNVYSEKEILKESMENLLKLKNPKKYLKIRENLKKECTDFINECENINPDIKKLPDIGFYKNYLIPKCNYIENIFLSGINEKKEHIKQMQKKIWDLEGTVKWYREDEIEKIKKIDELQNIVNELQDNIDRRFINRVTRKIKSIFKK